MSIVKKNAKSVKKKKSVNKKENNKFVSLLKIKPTFSIISNAFLLVLDLGLIIYTARGNIVNIVNINGRDMYVGEFKNLLFGRNYVSLVITLFIYLYFMVVDKFFLKNKFNIKKYLLVLICLILFNILLFYLFVNRVY